MTPEEMAKADQNIATIGDMLPKLWRRMYECLIEQGFDKEQAMQLLLAYIAATHRATG